MSMYSARTDGQRPAARVTRVMYYSHARVMCPPPAPTPAMVVELPFSQANRVTLLTTSRMHEHVRWTSCSFGDRRHSANSCRKRSLTTCVMSIHPMYLTVASIAVLSAGANKDTSAECNYCVISTMAYVVPHWDVVVIPATRRLSNTSCSLAKGFQSKCRQLGIVRLVRPHYLEDHAAYLANRLRLPHRVLHPRQTESLSAPGNAGWCAGRYTGHDEHCVRRPLAIEE